MRKIQTLEQQEAQQKRNVRILSVILVFLLLGSSVGYGFSLFLDSGGSVGATPITSTEPYFDGQQWIVTRASTQVALTYGPQDVLNTSIALQASLTDFSTLPVYISSSNDEVSNELYRVLTPYSRQLQQACYGPCELELPEKSCSDYLIVWTNSTANRVWQQDKCTFIEGDVRTVDAYLYYLLGYI